MILVTGGTGLLGSHLLFELAKSEQRIRCLYRDVSKIDNVRTLFDYYSKGQAHHFHAIEWVQGDLLDLVSLEDAFENVRIVYHCAAMVSFVRKDFNKMLDINRKGTANVVNFAIKYGVEKLGYVSSTATIGPRSGDRARETDRWSPNAKISGYALSKYNAEREVWRASQEGLNVVIINPSILLGAGDFLDSSMAIFESVRKGLKFYSPGSNAFVDARNVAWCFVKLMESPIKNERFLCTGINTSFYEMLSTIAEVLAVSSPTKIVPKWMAIFAGRLSESIAQITRKKPKITLETMRSAYAHETYSNEKIMSAIDIQWYSLNESFQNAKDFQSWKIDHVSH